MGNRTSNLWNCEISQISQKIYEFSKEYSKNCEISQNFCEICEIIKKILKNCEISRGCSVQKIFKISKNKFKKVLTNTLK